MTFIALIFALLAAYVEIRTRRRLGRSKRLVRQLRCDVERLQADLRHAKAERDQVSSDLDAAHLAGSALSADLHLARVQLADAHQTFESALAPLRESREQALRDRDAHAMRCVELTQRVTELEVRRDELTRGYCGSLHAFADGEMGPERHAAFLAHLVGCERCQNELIEVNQLNARLSVLPMVP